MDYSIIIIDDDQDFLESIRRVLTISGFKNLRTFQDPLEAAEIIEKREVFDIALIDINMPGMNGVELMDFIKMNSPRTECIVLTAVDDVRTAVKCLKKGAYDYLVKPISKEDLVASIQRVLEKIQLVSIADIRRNSSVPSLVNKKAFQSIVSGTASVQRILKEAELHARSSMPILITGASGTGKEILAKAIHEASPRADFRFVPINMAAITPSLFDAEFFGHTRGAFTGADKNRQGYLEYADKGTLFLDEIGMLPLELQGKLLRFLQEGEYMRLGSNKLQTADVRIITATNSNLKRRVSKRLFRRDLFYRLQGGWLHLPDLKDRKDDIPLLVNRFIDEFCRLYGHSKKTPFVIEDEAMSCLMAYDYPGNIRELKSIIHSTLNLTQGQQISTSDLPKNLRRVIKTITAGLHKATGALAPLASVEKSHIINVYQQTGRNKSQTARILGISLNTLRRKIDSYGLE